MTPRQQTALDYARKNNPRAAQLLERVYSGENISRSEAIKAKCYDCANYVREEIDQCRVETCPLWHLRPRFGDNKALQAGKQTGRKRAPMSEERKAKVLAGLANARKTRALAKATARSLIEKEKTQVSAPGGIKVPPKEREWI
jgi:hypothetical protein